MHFSSSIVTKITAFGGLFIFTLFSSRAFSQETLIYKAKKIYLCDTSFSTAEAMVIKGNRVLLTGTYDSAVHKYPDAKTINYSKAFIYPGFIDAHCHFLSYARGLKECNLVGTKSETEAVKKLKSFAKKSKQVWLVGRGWDQNDWLNKEYPTMESLDKAFPDKPVYLDRIDGHAAWINSAAMRALKFNPDEKIEGGEIIFKNGKFTGILIDKAAERIAEFLPDMAPEELENAVQTAAKNCYKVGLTTLDDAGLHVSEMNYLDSLQKHGKLRMRIYAMLTSEQSSYAWISNNGIYNSDRMHVSSVKFYLDGALGSRGALLKKDYCDKPGWRGLQLTPTLEFSNYCRFLFSSGYQACVHAIGDSANKIALTTYRNILPQGMDMRWRIEHVQVVDPKDFSLFLGRSIIPSVQPTHATSDATWATARLCENRLPGAYAYKSAKKAAGIVALGTDFPVEDIAPLKTFYSAVCRLDAAGKLKEPFLLRQGLERKETLLGMTIWAAIANIEENEKGSLENGKLADFVVLSQDLMTVPDKKIMKTKVKATYIGGEAVYK